MEFERRNGNGLTCEEIKCHDINTTTTTTNNNNNNNNNNLTNTCVKLKLVSVPNSCSSSPPLSSPTGYIEHHVSKLDTLAGIAIRYGVEVADVKKMNGLTTDFQMFARKTLHIPLPGRHPPSPCISNGHTSPRQTSELTSRRMHSDMYESFQSLRLAPDRKVSPAMSSLQGYYGLNDSRYSREGCEMTVYNKESSSHNTDEGFTTPVYHHKGSKSLYNGFKSEKCDPADNVKTNIGNWIDTLRKSDTELTRTPEKLLKEENGSGSWFSAITGKGLALRTKAASRTNLALEAETGSMNGFLTNPGDIMVENSSGVSKSSSTSSLLDQENTNSSFLWSTSKWSALKPDLTIFDGLPKPITGRRAKAALD